MATNNQKFSQEYVEKSYINKGCVLLDKYINTNTRMRYICKCGKENITTFYKFMKQKKGCKYCTKIGGYSHEDVMKYFSDNDCELLEEYTDVKKSMKYKCKCGRISYISFDNFKSGKRCRECGLEKLSEHFRENIEDVREYFIKNGCVPLFGDYKNDRTKLKYQCMCGNITYISFSDFKSGRRCYKCANERRNKTKYRLGNMSVSSQQIYIHSLVGGEINYPIKKSTVDIAFLDDKIYIEYDGSGHNLSVKIGAISESAFKEKEKRRKYALYKLGWREIRIISRKDYFPSDEKIKEIISYSKEILKERSWVIFDIDNMEIKYKNTIINYDFGKLKRFRVDNKYKNNVS